MTGMKSTMWTVSLFLGLFCGNSAISQVSPNIPRDTLGATPLGLQWEFGGLKLDHNRPDLIRQELLDPNTIRRIAKARGVSDEGLLSVIIAPDRFGDHELALQHLKGDEVAYTNLAAGLRAYIHERHDGHTREFVIMSVTNRVSLATVSDPDLRLLLAAQPLLVPSQVKKIRSGVITNLANHLASKTTSIVYANGKYSSNETVHIPKTNEVCRWVSFAVVDGEIAWQYLLQLKANGLLDHIDESKADAKDFDPAFENIMKSVEDEAIAEMKKDGSYGKFGSVHGFWWLKREKLKAKGIHWRSPAELNPNTCYD